jgi:hypothetical protein
MNFIRPLAPITDALMSGRPITDSMVGRDIMVMNHNTGERYLAPSKEAMQVLRETPEALARLKADEEAYEAMIARRGYIALGGEPTSMYPSTNY